MYVYVHLLNLNLKLACGKLTYVHVFSIVLGVFSVNSRIILHKHEGLLCQSCVHAFQGMARVYIY